MRQTEAPASEGLKVGSIIDTEEGQLRVVAILLEQRTDENRPE